MDYLIIVLVKGWIEGELFKKFKKMGLGDSIDIDMRKLIFKDEENKIIYIYVKLLDVVIYVEKGVVDFGIVGKDIILENEIDVYEIYDLGFGKCKFVVVGLKGDSIYREDEYLKVVIKYFNIVKKYFKEKG